MQYSPKVELWRQVIVLVAVANGTFAQVEHGHLGSLGLEGAYFPCKQPLEWLDLVICEHQHGLTSWHYAEPLTAA